jgi:hypothetical protein
VSRNLVLALADGLTAEQLRPFLYSTDVMAERPEMMFFGGRFDPETIALLDEYQVRIAPFSSVWDVSRRRRNRLFTVATQTTMAAVRLTSRLFDLRGRRRSGDIRRRMIGPILPPLHARFFLYHEALEAVYPRVKRVLLTDVRDVVFQADPFTFAEDKLWVFEEDSRLNMQLNEENRAWYLKTFGSPAFQQVMNFPVICAGTVLGGREATLQYLRTMTTVMITRPPVVGGDQAIHNHICRGDHVAAEIVPNEAGVVLTLYNITDAEVRYDNQARVVNTAGQPYPILHMYDRLPVLKQRVLKRLGL